MFTPDEGVSRLVDVALVVPMQIQTPEYLFFAPERKQPKREPGAGGKEGGGSPGGGLKSPQPGSGGDSAPGSASVSEETPASPASPAPPAKEERLRPFRFPENVKRVDSPQTIIQPSEPPDIVPLQVIQLPDIIFASVDVPAPEPLRKFVAPGQRQPNVEKIVLDAPPKLELPNSVPTVATVKFAEADITNSLAQLTVPPATSVLMATSETKSDEEGQFAGYEERQGDALHLLALNSMPMAPGPILTVFPGNQVGAGFGAFAGGTAEASGDGQGGSSPGSDGTGAGLSGGGGNGKGSGGGSGSDGIGSGTGPDSGPGQQLGSGSGGLGSGLGGSGSGSGSGTGRGTGLAGTGSGSGTGRGSGSGAGGNGSGFSLGDQHGPNLLGNAPGVRIEHPETGVFDIVVIQSSALEGILEQKGLLSGVPVYTVYLKVGMDSEWIMQFCKPDTGFKSSGSVIQLSAPNPISAPYPRETVLPPLELLPDNKRVIIHGFLGETGKFIGLEAVRGEIAAPEKFLSYLSYWRFRPATQDGVPLEVEVLLVVPAVQRRDGD